jgi:hypothetical protein
VTTLERHGLVQDSAAFGTSQVLVLADVLLKETAPSEVEVNVAADADEDDDDDDDDVIMPVPLLLLLLLVIMMVLHVSTPLSFHCRLRRRRQCLASDCPAAVQNADGCGRDGNRLLLLLFVSDSLEET